MADTFGLASRLFAIPLSTDAFRPLLSLTWIVVDGAGAGAVVGVAFCVDFERTSASDRRLSNTDVLLIELDRSGKYPDELVTDGDGKIEDVGVASGWLVFTDVVVVDNDKASGLWGGGGNPFSRAFHALRTRSICANS